MSPYALIPNQVCMALPTLPESAIRVAIALGMHADADGFCYPSISTLAIKSGLSSRAVRLGIKALVNSNLLTVETGGSNGRDSNQYRWVGVNADSVLGGTGIQPRGERRRTLGVNVDSPKQYILNIPNNTCAGMNVDSALDDKIHSIPSQLQGLELFENDKQLVAKFSSLLASWRKAYPDVNHRQEIGKAHSWLVSNPKRQKKNNGQFLSNWMGRAKPDPVGEDAPDELGATWAGHLITCKALGIDPHTCEPLPKDETDVA